MTIQLKSVVAIHYTLKDDEGAELDSTSGADPMVYLHGAGNIIRGLEQALLGKKAGDKIQATVEPAEAYGEFIAEMVQTVPRSVFADQDVEVGMRFNTKTERGPLSFAVKDVGEEEVTVDGNHPLAGQTLHFDISVEAVREATEQELIHGHVHGQGGCGHDH
ncbi:MAG: peptidylprolyl isomerase [Porticoccaceae bacterium]|nr:peptidylprolyl isomerase [Porticoccaceae bacterium]